MDYHGILPESSFRDILLCLLSTFEDKEAMTEEATRMLWNHVIDAGDGRRDKKK